MIHNLGETDRALRIFFGFVLIFVGIVSKSWWALGGVLLATTGIMGYSLLYALLKISTSRKQVRTLKPKKTMKRPAKRA